MSVKNPGRRACRVIISVSGGVADAVFKPMGLELCIVDYDVDGAEDQGLDHDPDGAPCRVVRWPAGSRVIGNRRWPMVRTAARRITAHGQSRWQCPGCRRIVRSSKASLAEAGTPYCADCDRHMRPL